MKDIQQVIIVGGGPVGMGLAIELGLRDISCALIEPRSEIHRIPKGQNLMQRTLDHFYCWGISDELRAMRVMPDGYPIGTITTYGDLMSDYWYKPQQREAVKDFFFQKNERLPQYCMEQVLLDKIATLENIVFYRGWAANHISQDEKCVTVDIESTDGSDRNTLRADYLVGCDGSRSVVRDSIGIERSGSDYDQKMVLAVFRSTELHEGLKCLPEVSTYRAMFPEAEGYWHFLGRIDVGEGWFFHAPVPLDTRVDNYDFKALLHKAAGFKFECEFEHVGFWDLRVAIAETYQKKRIFIAGDAAHSHPPYGGFGVNNGLEDARNLGWKLAGKLRGWGGDKLISSYSEERYPVFKETGEDFIATRIKQDAEFFNRYNPQKNLDEFHKAWNEKKAGTSKLATAYEPHYEGSSVIAGPPGGVCSAHGEHLFKAREGHHLAPLILSSGENVFEKIGNEFSLLAFDGDKNIIQAFEKAFCSGGIHLRIIEDSLSDSRLKFEAKYILVRPDHYIAWKGNEAPEIDSLIKRITGN